MMPDRKHFFAIIIVVVLGFTVYANSLGNAFLWDDINLVEKNVYLRSWRYLPRVFSGNIGAGAGIPYPFYRPLQIITYMLDYSLWGLNPLGYHFSNIIYHILAALCFYWLVLILFRDSLLSLLTALLFVVNPVLTEAVTYISGRAYPLALIFVSLTFICYLKFLQQRKIFIFLLLVFSYLLALFSQEASLVLPGLLLVYHLVFRKRINFAAFFTVLSVALLYIAARLTSLVGFLPRPPDGGILFSIDALRKIPGFFSAIANYLKLLMFPVGLHMEYGEKLFRFTDPAVITGVVIFFFLLWLTFTNRRRQPIFFLACYWFFITLLPACNLYPLSAYMAERWLYLPAAGFSLALAGMLAAFWKNKQTARITVLAALTLAAGYSYLTIRQNTYWREPLSFFQRTLRYAPDSLRVLDNLGAVYLDRGDYDKAISCFNRALEIDPDYAWAYYNRGNVHNSLGEFDRAISDFTRAVEINQDYFLAYSNRGIIYSRQGKYNLAIVDFNRALKINPHFAYGYNNWAVVYMDKGEYTEAISYLNRALAIDPDYAQAYNNRAIAYFMKKEYAKARADVREAQRLGLKISSALLQNIDYYSRK